jgi:acyl-coenzyme A thioesterase PaaI-like protein
MPAKMPLINTFWLVLAGYRAIAMTEQAEIDAQVAFAVEQIMRALYPSVTTSGEPGFAVTGEALFDPQPEHVGAPGWVQGGLSATVLDYFCARLASTALAMRVATGTLDLRYRQPVLLAGGPYLVSGSTEQPRSKSVRVRGTILSADRRPLIEANGLFVGTVPLEPDR